MAEMPNGFPARPASYDKKVGLVLQGGGALGSYQAGVYEALASSEYLPDWVAFRLKTPLTVAISRARRLRDRPNRRQRRRQHSSVPSENRIQRRRKSGRPQGAT